MILCSVFSTASHFPRATDYIPEMLAFIQGLIDKGYAYAAAGDVYFDVSKDSDYGKLCNRDPKMMEAGSRIEVSDRKRNANDFALWKGAKPGEPSWESPWGPGRPGWHIECSAMSMKLLGSELDIHGGGLDLQFPHHENELAQSESYSGKPFARAWMHNGLMMIRSQKKKIKDAPPGDDAELEKISKSLGNEIVVKAVLEKYPADVLRILLLSTQYRSPIEYSEDRLNELSRNVDGFYRFFERVQRTTGQSYYALPAAERHGPFEPSGAETEFLSEVARLRQNYLDFMNDDFNTGGAVGVLNELLTSLNRFADARKLESPSDNPASEAFLRSVKVLRELTSILGLFREASAKASAADDQLIDGLMRLIIDIRNEARKTKNFAVSDQIRDRLKELKITLEDRQGQTGWRIT
jgi:cysteinyl-tRNA synthetase